MIGTGLFDRACVFVSSVLIARHLGAEGKGVYTLLLLVPGTLAVLTQVGLGNSLAYHVASGRGTDRQLYRWSLIAHSASIVLALAAGWILVGPFGASVLGDVPARLSHTALFLAPLMILIGHYRAILTGRQLWRPLNIMTGIRAVSSLLGTAVVVGLLQGGPPGLLIVEFALTLGTLVALAWMVRGLNVRKNGRSPVTTRAAGKSLLSFGLASQLSSILFYLTFRVDYFIVNALLDPASVGIYGVGVGGAEKLWLLSSSAALALYPRIASLKGNVRKRRFTGLVTRTVLAVSLVLGLVAWFCVPALLRVLFGEPFQDSGNVFRILLPGAIAMSVARILGSDLGARGRPLLNGLAAGATLVVNTSLDFLLIPRWGVAGAAWAATLAYGFHLFLVAGLYVRVSGGGFAEFLRPRLEDGRDLWRRAFRRPSMVKRKGEV